MKGVLDLLRRAAPREAAAQDSSLFTTAFADQGVDPSMLIPWEARANEVGAKRLSGARGMVQLQALWARDKYMSRLDAEAVALLEKFFDFASVHADRDVIRQEEYGNFMIVVLSGSIAIDRYQPWGERMRLTEARPGDILGEMSLLDSGMRFSSCITLTECDIAVLGAEAMDQMMRDQPQLAAALVALLARKLSMRLRMVGARLSER
ncbi:MAG: cyclic nucleotide-binding domain-containing protein [Pseudomonadota bacterium]